MNGPSLFTPPITIGGTTYGSNATGTSHYDQVDVNLPRGLIQAG
jgi:hypothetical protein